MRKVIVTINGSSFVGYFHGFFQSEWDGSAGPVVVVEKENGDVEEYDANSVRFETPPNIEASVESK